jgi:GTP pyrophosphokinase
MWRSLVLASLMHSAPLGADRTERLATVEGIDALASEVGTVDTLTPALSNRLTALQTTRDARLADETLRVFSPLAERAGLDHLRSALDDASFAILAPARHAPLAVGTAAREALALRLARDTHGLLDARGISGEVSWRTKSAWSTFRKMQRKGIALDEVYDRIALRLIVDEPHEAYALLDALHDRYPAIAGETDDYIRQPKANGYQSLHTAVRVDGQAVEFQLRTWAMHEAAEAGDAAHWRYKLVG